MKTFTDLYKDATKKQREKLMADLGVSLATLSRWSSGQRTPSILKAIQIEKVTGVSVYSWDKRPYVFPRR